VSNKLKLANAKLAKALVTAKLHRSRVIRAKQRLDVANAYLSHVHWTLERSKHRDVIQDPSHVITVTDGQLGPQGMGTVLQQLALLTALGVVNHFIDIPGGSLAITLD